MFVPAWVLVLVGVALAVLFWRWIAVLAVAAAQAVFIAGAWCLMVVGRVLWLPIRFFLWASSVEVTAKAREATPRSDSAPPR